MNILILSSLFIIFSGLIFKKHIFKKTDIFVAFVIVGVIIRLVFGYFYFGHNTDVNDFLSWSDMLFKGGISSFYASNSFTDYPPGYMYVLWLVGFLKNTLNLSKNASVLLVKLPAIAADIAGAVILKNYLPKENSAAAVLLLFNPTAILNSSVWGQTDSVFVLFLVISIIALTKKNPLRAYIGFAAAVIIKPQSCMYAPLYIYFLAEGIKSKNAKTHFKAIGISFAAVIVLILPFGVKNVISQYIATLSSYPYATVNAFNIWASLGLNWCKLSPTVTAAGIFFTASTATAAFYMLRGNDNTKYFRTALFICMSVFMLSVKMHERYLYPAMIFAVFCMGRNPKKYVLYLLITASHFFNTAYILFVYESNPSLYYNSSAVIIASFVNIIIFLYTVYLSEYPPRDSFTEKKAVNAEKSILPNKFTKYDRLSVFIITAVYFCIAFSNLGDFSAPQTEYKLGTDKITLFFEKEEELASVDFFLGSLPLSDENFITISAADTEITADDADVFSFNSADLGKITAESITLYANAEIPLKELRIKNTDGEYIFPINASEFTELFDEQLPNMRTYTNSTYFDEIYHARTAYEFIHKLPVYEWTHPPLGKIFISLGIRLFGMNTFGWRCIGTLFGVFMVPLIYLLAKLLFKKTWLSSAAAIIFAFDFMHYVQTRIATIDVYVTFFIMLMYMFMFAYSYMSFYDMPLKKTFIPLVLCGISSGLAISCKWTGIYALFGVAVIFFVTLSRRYAEYCTDKSLKFHKNTVLTLLFCVLCFIIIPVSIYCLSYIPYLSANGEGFFGIWKNQLDIFTYHAKTVVASEHPYSSKWYTWPLMLRPIWYYSAEFANGNEAGISAFGNPLVWWGGIAACIFCIFNAVKYKDKKAILLLIAYASNFLPWAIVQRTMFIYHYFPSVPFIVLMTVYSANILSRKNHKIKYAAYVYILGVVLLFALFYPVLTGTEVNPNFVKDWLRWLPGWVLIK